MTGGHDETAQAAETHPESGIGAFSAAGLAPQARENTMTDQKIIEPETVVEDRPVSSIRTTTVSGTPHHGDEEIGGALTGGIAGAAIGAVVGGAIGAASGATLGAVDTRRKDAGDEVVVTREEHRS